MKKGHMKPWDISTRRKVYYYIWEYKESHGGLAPSIRDVIEDGVKRNRACLEIDG
jgi:hypothetical protein